MKTTRKVKPPIHLLKKMKALTHGGKRKDAGRPKLPPELKKEETVTMRIPKSKVPAVLATIGKALD